MKLNVSRINANILTVNRKNHHPIETFSVTVYGLLMIRRHSRSRDLNTIGLSMTSGMLYKNFKVQELLADFFFTDVLILGFVLNLLRM